MTDDLDQRLEKLEGVSERVVVILEGEPVLDIDGTKIGTTGGVVKQLERHAEALHVMDHKHVEALHVMDRKLDTITEAVATRGWSRGQRIAASSVVVVFLVGMIPVVARAF